MTAQPPAAPETETDANRWVEVLAAHEVDLSALRRDRATKVGYWMACTCGFEWTPIEPFDTHQHHLAEVIATAARERVRVVEGERDAVANLCRKVIEVHDHVVMDTPKDRDLHDRAIATFSAHLDLLVAGNGER